MPLLLEPTDVGALHTEAAATSGNVRVLRRELCRWLSAVVDDPDVVDDLCLVASEAIENAVDHAYIGRSPGTVRLDARYEGSEPETLVLVISDDGRWQPPGAPGHRGRGLALVGEIASSHHLDTGPDGTVLTIRRRV